LLVISCKLLSKKGVFGRLFVVYLDFFIPFLISNFHKNKNKQKQKLLRMKKKFFSFFAKSASSDSLSVESEILESRTYLPNQKAYIPTDSMGATNKLLMFKLDHYLRTTHVIVPLPILLEEVTWEMLSSRNENFEELKKSIEEIECCVFPQESLNVVARRLVSYVISHHELVN